MSLRKRFLTSTGLTVLGTAAAAFLTELVFALLIPQPVLHAAAPDIFFVRHDEGIGWVNKEGAEGVYKPGTGIPAARVRINAHGMRGGGVTAKKPPGVKRVLVLGDSNAFGYGVKEAEGFPGVLSRLLPNDYEVLNLGVFGYGTDQAALLLKRTGIRFAADVVVLAFSAGDLSDNMNSINAGYPKPYFTVENGGLVLRNTPVPGESPFMRASKRSALTSLLYDRSHLYRFVHGRLMKTSKYLAGSVPEMSEEEAMGVTVALVRDMDGFCKAQGCRLALLLISHGQWVDALRVKPDLRVGYYPVLKGILTRMGIPVIDTTEGFVRGPAGLFFPKDPVHLTPAGNEAAARALLEGLVRFGLLPGER
jgi:lysophospholipase L1-like esterase